MGKEKKYIRDDYPEREEEIRKDIHEFVHHLCNNNIDCTNSWPIEYNREKRIDRLNDFVIPLLILLFQFFVIILGIVYIVSFIIWLFN